MFIFETTYINLREVSNRKRNNQTSKKDHMSHDTIHIRQLYSCIQLYHIHHISPYSSYSLYSCNCNHHISSYLDINHAFIYHHHRIFKQYISRLQPKKSFARSILPLLLRGKVSSRTKTCGLEFGGNKLPSRELTYPTLGKGKSSTQKCRLGGRIVYGKQVNRSLNMNSCKMICHKMSQQ